MRDNRRVPSGAPESPEHSIQALLIALSLLAPAGAALYLWATRRLRRSHQELQARFAEAVRSAGDAQRRADEANAAKTRFLSSMSHQIRTPMSGIIGMTDVLAHTALSSEQREYTETIGNSGRVLLGIIDDIIDLARVQDGKLQMERERFDLRRTVEDAIELVAPAAEQKRVDLALRYSPEAPREFVGDAKRIGQVVLNLLGNAVKFTNQGYVLAEVAAEDSGTIRISVEDSGSGIPEHEHQDLFKEFTSLESAGKSQGTGLGLAISKKLVELMGGSIGFRSEAGAGSTFWFRLAMEAAPGAPAEPRPEEPRGRVLVAAPKSLGRKILSELLAQMAMQVDQVEAPDDVLEAMGQASAAGSPFTAAILDLPGLGVHAHALATGIRRDPALRTAGIVIAGSATDRVDAARLAEVVRGVWLRKPVRASELENALAESLSAPGRDDGPLPSLTLEELESARWRWEVLLVEDNAVNQRVALAQLKSIGCRVEVAANGREAIERIRTKSYDVIFMDCVMPEMDGFEATRRIRLMEGDQRPIIVAMTARAYPEDRQRCRDAGMDDYLAKPVLAQDMQNVLERWKPAARRR